MNNILGFCGVNCSECPDYLSKKCPSCKLTEWTDDIYPAVNCCLEKGIDFCAFCDSFPCKVMTGFYEESESHKEAFAQMCSMKNG